MAPNTQDNTPVIISNDEIDLIAIFQILWRGKWLIMGITCLFTIASIAYALKLPNIYQSTALLTPTESSSQPKTGQLQGLASIAGMNLGAKAVDKTDIAIATLESHRFINNFIKQKKIIIPLMTITGWNQLTNTPIYNEEIYDRTTQKWAFEKEAKPSNLMVYGKFKNILTITKDPVTSFIEVSIDFPVPELAQAWVTELVEDINKYSREKAIKQSQESIEYLQEQLNKTQVADIRTIFFGLIKQETQKILLAETRKEYIFETIDPPIIPEIKNSPKRALIVIISTILGGLLSLIITLVIHIFKTPRRT